MFIYTDENGKITGLFACQQYEGQEEVLDDSEEVLNFGKPDREEEFNKAFFQTSLGYVRRKVYMQGTGETKDFLSDCLPVLANAFAMNQNIQAILYDKPPMTSDVEDWSQYQKTIDWTRPVQQQFLGECFVQYQIDFFGV